MFKFPYGISDFAKIIQSGYWYVDRTDHLRLIEDAGEQLLFLRPRRFGKSLVLSMLENYYDLAKADQFDQLFGPLKIGANPTPKHNQYFVMKWDFSMVKTDGDHKAIELALYHHLNAQIQDFAMKYQLWLPLAVSIEPQDALFSFQSALTAIQRTPYKLYLLIDEYDNFANRVLMRPGVQHQGRYQDLVTGEGLLKTVFSAVKAASAGRGLDKVFLTGVSPLLMSDVTSGYNVAKSIYLEPKFHDLCGFTEAEVLTVLEQIVSACQLPATKVTEALDFMRTLYNGYGFARQPPHLIYNPTLSLYFFDQFQENCAYPSQPLDDNLAMDADKLAYISRLTKGGQLLLDALTETTPVTVTQLEARFSVEKLWHPKADQRFLGSLLYYFGVLTMAGQTELGELRLAIPNLVVRHLYVERLLELLLPQFTDQDEAVAIARQFYATGNLQPVCEFIETRFRVFDNRDYQWSNELMVKTAFLLLLFNDRWYLMDSETELNRRYADLSLILRPDARPYPLFDHILEFKYLALKEDSKHPLTGEQLKTMTVEELRALPFVQRKLAEAREQLQVYGQELQARYGQLRLHSHAVVGIGFERFVWESWEGIFDHRLKEDHG
jgi:hypothetical protein